MSLLHRSALHVRLSGRLDSSRQTSADRNRRSLHRLRFVRLKLPLRKYFHGAEPAPHRESARSNQTACDETNRATQSRNLRSLRCGGKSFVAQTDVCRLLSASGCLADDRSGIVESRDATARSTFRTRPERILTTENAQQMQTRDHDSSLVSDCAVSGSAFSLAFWSRRS